MKKIVKILLVGLLALTLVACSSETIDAAGIYEEARANMEALDSYTMEASIVMAISGENEDDTEESTCTVMIYTFVGLTSDAPSEYYSVTVSYSDAEETVEMWLVDDIVYYSVDDDKYTLEAEDIEVSTVDLFTYIDDTENITGTSNGDGYFLELTIDGETFLEIMDAISEDSDLFADATVEDTVIFTVEVSGDGYITSASVSASIELDGVGTLSMTLEFTYYDFDSATLPELDTDAFASADTDVVYGDYDLTTDNANDLIAAGYEDMGNYLYSNGTYIIDLELKQIYSSDTIYDWEYDQAVLFDEDFNFTCGYDFYNDISEGDCDVEAVQELRDVYNELASSILESEE